MIMKQTLNIIFLTILFVLGVSSCSDVSEQEGLPPVGPAPGERMVNLSLTGLAGGGAVPTRADNESLTLAGECEVRALTIYCFVSWDGATEQNDVANFKHERTYRYEAGGTDNDFLLLPDADGYHAGIGVPEGDAYRRAFLVCANREIANSPVDWANLTYGTAVSDFKWTLAQDPGAGGTGTYLPPACPLLPMSAKVTHRVISSEGAITDDPVFSRQRLDQGLSVSLTRGVSRIDVVNPDITGYRVEGIEVKAATEMPLYSEPQGTAATTYQAVPLSVPAAQIAGACYLFPLRADTEVQITLTGKLMNNELPLTARGVMKPNTRYLLRVRNDDANVGVSLEVADWNEGNGMDTDDLSGKLNTGCTVAAETGVTLAGNTITLKDGCMSASAPAIVTLTGASGDEKPIGIQVPEGCDWLVAGTGQVTGSPGTFQISLEMKQPAVSPASGRIGGGGSNGRITVGNDYPLRVPVGFAYEKDGKPCFAEYTVCLEPGAEWDRATLASVEVCGSGMMKDLCRVDPDARVIRLPAFEGAAFRVIGHRAVTRAAADGNLSDLEFFALEDYDWVKKVAYSPSSDEADLYLYFQAGENTTGQAREAAFRMRYRDAGNGGGPVETDWLVVQDSRPDPALMADDVEVKLPLREAGELWMEGGEIRVSMHDPLFMGAGGGAITIYEGYIRTLREKGTVAAGNQLKAVMNRIDHTVATNGSGVEDNPLCIGLLYPALSAPVKVTADASWLHVDYEVDTPCVSLKADLYLPAVVEEIDNLPARTATVTVELRNGKTRKLTVRQEPYSAK